MSEISNNREESRENDRGKEKEPLLRRAMDAFGTIFALNVCFVVGCIPIFTVGASLSALYAMCIRLQEDEEETVVAGFIHEFKRNFKQSTIAYFFILLAIFVMYFEFLLVKRVTGFISTFYKNDRGKEKEPLLRRAMDAFGTIFALNVCFVVGCIPIFTVGASLSALYAMCIRLQEDEEETVVAGFIHEFKRNFKQSTIAYFFILLAIFVMYFEFLLVKRVTGFISTFYTGILVTELIFMGLIVPFLFPLIARYNNKLGTTVRNSLALAITYKGSWLKVFIAWFAPIFICVRYPIIFVNIWYLWVLFIFGAIAYGTSTTMRKIFRLNEKKLEETARKAEEEAKKAKEEAEAAAKLLEAEAEAEEKDKEDTGNKEDLDSEQA